MLRTALRTGSILTLLASAGLAFGQPPAQPRKVEVQVQPAQTQPAQTVPGTNQNQNQVQTALRVKSILGATVSLQGGSTGGTVHDIVLNEDGVVDYLVVSDNGKLVTVPWEAAKFNFEKRTAVINITQDQYRQIPTYTQDRYPDFYTPAYRTQVYRYYGLTPGRERRIERREDRRP